MVARDKKFTLKNLIGTRIAVKFNGGREIEGEMIATNGNLTFTLVNVIEKRQNLSKLDTGSMEFTCRIDAVSSMYGVGQTTKIGNPFSES